MELALTEAKKAYDMGEVPIGAVLVDDESGVVVAAGHNLREINHDATAHAEMEVIRKACEKLGRWRLSGTTLYVTIEPCPMCASAILQARIKKIYFGAYDYLYGAFGTKCDMRKIMNYSADVKGGILEQECTKILKDYFEEIRNA